MIYIGLDVHKVNTKVACLDGETGEISDAYDWPTAQLAEHLTAQAAPTRIVMEAGSSSSFVARQLKSLGVEVMVVDAFRSHRLLEAMQTAKTDKLAAQGLAAGLAGGYLEGAAVWVGDEASYELRELTRTRQALTEQTTRLRNCIRAFLVRHGPDCPYRDLLGQKATPWLDQRQAQLPVLLAVTLGAMRGALGAVNEQIKAVAAAVSAQAQSHPQARLLATIPGIGPLLAPAIVAEIGAISRFPSAAHLRSYSGLVPRISQSGQRRYSGPLTKRGNRFLRWAMVLAAQHFGRLKATENLALRKWYGHLVWKHGRNPAKVALARRLLDIIFAMLRDGVEFDPARLAVADRDR